MEVPQLLCVASSLVTKSFVAAEDEQGDLYKLTLVYQLPLENSQQTLLLPASLITVWSRRTLDSSWVPGFQSMVQPQFHLQFAL